MLARLGQKPEGVLPIDDRCKDKVNIYVPSICGYQQLPKLIGHLPVVFRSKHSIQLHSTITKVVHDGPRMLAHLADWDAL